MFHYCDADILQQGSVPAHWRVHQTIELLQRETPKFTDPEDPTAVDQQQYTYSCKMVQNTYR